MTAHSNPDDQKVDERSEVVVPIDLVPRRRVVMRVNRQRSGYERRKVWRKICTPGSAILRFIRALIYRTYLPTILRTIMRIICITGRICIMRIIRHRRRVMRCLVDEPGRTKAAIHSMVSEFLERRAFWEHFGGDTRKLESQDQSKMCSDTFKY